LVVVVLFVVYYCHFLLLDQKKVTKEKIKADPIAPRVLPGLRAGLNRWSLIAASACPNAFGAGGLFVIRDSRQRSKGKSENC
jgi:hypothetical protein